MCKIILVGQMTQEVANNSFTPFSLLLMSLMVIFQCSNVNQMTLPYIYIHIQWYGCEYRDHSKYELAYTVEVHKLCYPLKNFPTD